MKVTDIDKFWYVMRYQPRTNPQDKVTVPRRRHNTLEEAQKEAIRLAKCWPNANFVVLEAINFVSTPPPVSPEPKVILINGPDVAEDVVKSDSPQYYRRLSVFEATEALIGGTVFTGQMHNHSKHTVTAVHQLMAWVALTPPHPDCREANWVLVSHLYVPIGAGGT